MHIDDSDLALLALGEPIERDRTHLESCVQCRSEVESLSTVSEIMAAGGPMPVQAPAHLWTAIEAAITADGTADGTAATVPDQEPADITTRRAYRDRAAATNRRFTALSLLGAAAVGAGVMWLGTSLATDDGLQPGQEATLSEAPDDADPSQEDVVEPDIVASADLAALEETVDPATAEIIERDGQRLLRVDTASLPEVEDGYLQVWLLEDDVAGMVTIGALTASGEEFVLPDGLSTDTFTTIDVSVEHYDGNPEHSGESLWRGAITST